jgi:hypothetical protein
VIDGFAEWFVCREFLFRSTFDLQMIESLIRIVDMNDLCTCLLVKSHDGAHVDRQSIGQRFLLELFEDKRSVIRMNRDPTDGRDKRSVVAGSIDGSMRYADFGKKYVTFTPP